MKGDPQKITARDRELFFGVIAVQNRLITPQQLAQAAVKWAQNQDTDLGDQLIGMGFLSAEEKQAVDHLVAFHLSSHGGDASAALSRFGGESVLHSSFGGSLRVTENGVECSLESFGGDLVRSLSVREGPLPGERLDDPEKVTHEHPGRYTIYGTHGEGGIGIVKLAYDEHIGREVALKELRREKCGDGSPSGISPSRFSAAVVRFLREARITGQLEHPAIVPVYEIARRADGTIYYTMKLVRGKTLAQCIYERRTLSERLAILPHFIDICQAMAYAHSKEIIHRDLKPQNVMVGSFGETVVLDWGLAKLRSDKEIRGGESDKGRVLIRDSFAGETVDGSAIGTPAYMSPEQAAGKIAEIDEKSDVWSLGAILYEILTGQPPFTGDLAYEVMGKVITDPVVPVREREPSAPPELAAIAEKCLSKDREQRYKNAAELAEDMVRYQTGGLVSAYQYSMTALVVKWVKRYWPMVTTVGAAVLALLIVGSWSYFRIRDERNSALLYLAEAALRKGQQAEDEARWGEARLFYSKALALTGREDARMALYRGELQSIRIAPLQTFTLQAGYAQALAFSPDRQTIAAGGSEPIITLYSTQTGQTLRTITGHQGAVISLAFSPDGRLLASGSRDTTIKLWEPDTSHCQNTLTGHADAVSALAFSPDGKTLLAGSQDAGLKLWPIIPSGPPRDFAGHMAYISAVAFLPDGKHALSASGDKTLKLWNIETGSSETLTGHQADVWSLAVAPDGKTALSGDLAGKLIIWDLENKKPIGEPFNGNQGPIYSLAMARNARFALSAGRGRNLRYWDLSRRKCMNDMLVHGDSIYALVLSEDGKQAVTAGGDRTVKLWGLHFLEPEKSWKLSRGNFSTFSADGRLVLSGETKNVPAPGRCLSPPCLSLLLVNPDNTPADTWWQTAEADLVWEPLPDEIVLWSLPTGECLLRLCGKRNYLKGAAISPDGKMAAYGGEAGAISVCSLVTGLPVKTLLGHQSDVTALAFTPDNKQLLSAADDHTVRLWSLETGQALQTFASPDWGYALSLLLSPDGKHFIVNGDSWNSLRCWALDRDTSILTLASDHDSFKAFAFSPDGKKILTGGCAERQSSACVKGEFKLFDFPRGKLLKTVVGTYPEVTAVAFSPDGKFGMTGHRDGTIKLWELRRGDCLMTFSAGEGGSAITYLAFSSDGNSIISRDGEGTISIKPSDWTLFSATKGESGERLYHEAEKESGLTLEGLEIKPLQFSPQ